MTLALYTKLFQTYRHQKGHTWIYTMVMCVNQVSAITYSKTHKWWCKWCVMIIVIDFFGLKGQWSTNIITLRLCVLNVFYCHIISITRDLYLSNTYVHGTKIVTSVGREIHCFDQMKNVWSCRKSFTQNN